jgi:hypothetical protein
MVDFEFVVEWGRRRHDNPTHQIFKLFPIHVVILLGNVVLCIDLPLQVGDRVGRSPLRPIFDEPC